MLKKCNETMSCDALQFIKKAWHFIKIKGGKKNHCQFEQCKKKKFYDF